jgi:hypothetical protein
MLKWPLLALMTALSIAGAAVAQVPSAGAKPVELVPGSTAVTFDFDHMTVKQGSIKNREVIVRLPFTYKRTGTLRNDVRNSFYKNMVWLPAGSPGFFAGRFGEGDGHGYDLWCFYSLKAKPGTLPMCIGNRFGKPGGNFTYDIMWTQAPFFEYLPITNNHGGFVTEPVIDEGAVNFPGGLYIDLAIRKWSDNYVFPEWFFGKTRIIGYAKDTFEADGRLNGGIIHFRRDPDNKDSTIVTYQP